MTRPRRTTGLALAACAALVLSMHAPASADPQRPTGHDNGKHLGSDVRNVGPDYNHGKALRLMQKASAQARQQARQQAQRQQPVGRDKVGDTKTWLALDDIKGIYLKSYTLRGIGQHIQVWVANDRAFPGTDCRNDLGLTDITTAQVNSFVHEFDTNIYPTESEAFSVAPDRNGKQARTDLMGLPNNYYQTTKQGADDTVVLVDNVRDSNYYTPDAPDGQTYIAGFFYSTFNEYTDRNIMTIDAYDWLHRTGANPPDDSADGAYQGCPYASGAPRPHLYEGTFAHEYQHLLEYYQDPDEASWVNEGLSDYAQTLVGYVDPAVTVTDPAADSHIACFSGFLSEQGYGGPENSLTAWGDQGDPEILCDYGAAYSFMQYLFGHYGGESFLSALHREPGNGLVGLQNVLDASGSSDQAIDVVHRWLATMALDNPLDTRALAGGDAAAYSEETLGSQINWDASYDDINHDGTSGDVGNEAYSTPGAPNNGADYVAVDPGLSSLSFSGASSYEPDPMPWTSVTDAPDHGSDAALYSGTGDEVDQSAVLPVSVPSSGDATLSFDTKYLTEADWDFFFVQLSNDGGKTWKSLPIDGTTSTADPSAYPTVQANLPGFTGDSGGWVSKSYDLKEFAGQDVLVNFRYVTDWATHEAGVWLDNVAVGGTNLLDGSSTAILESMTEVNPVPVAGWTVQVVAYGDDGAWIGSLGLQAAGDRVTGALTADQLTAMQAATGTNRTVGALVTADDPAESARKYARYALTVDNEVQPGG